MGKANAKENPKASKYNNNTTSLQKQKKKKKRKPCARIKYRTAQENKNT